MKRFIYVVFAVLIVSIVTVLAAPSFIDLSVYKGQVVDAFKKQTGLDLKLAGQVDIAFLPSPQFVAEDVTISSSQSGEQSEIVSFDSLMVNVSVIPLLQGNVSVQSVTLVKPIVTIEARKDGSFNFSTAQSASIEGDKDAEAEQGEKKATSTLPQVSLDKIHVKDGTFIYKDQKAGSTTEVRNINADLGAQSLNGPFWAQGSLFYDRSSIDFDIKTKKLDQENKLISTELTLALKPDGVTVGYSGVISFGNEVSLQGHTTLNIASLKDSLEPYGAGQIINENVPIQLKGLVTLEGSKVSLKDINFNIAEQAIDMGATLSLSPFSYQLSLKNNNALDLSKITNATFPFKTLSADLKVNGDTTNIYWKNSNLKLDDTAFKTSGKYTIPAISQKRGKVHISVNADEINYDDFAVVQNDKSNQKPSNNNTGQAIKKSAYGFSLPVDMSVDLSVKELVYKNKVYKKLRVKGDVNDNTMNLSQLSLADYEGANVSAKADITNVKLLSGINAYLTVDVRDVPRFASALSLDVSNMPKSLKTAKLKAKLDGDIEAINLTANIEAIDGEVIAKGKVQDILDAAKVNDLALQVKHKSVAKAVQAFTGVKLDQRVFGKALNFYTKVNQSGSRYILSAIKANVSGIDVQGDVDLNLSAAKPDIKGNLKFGTLALNSIMNKGSSHGAKHGSKASKPSTSSSGRWSKEAIDTAALHAMNLDISVSAKKIEYGQWPLVSPALSLKLKDGHLKITDLSAGLFGGRIASVADIKTVSKPRQPLYVDTQSTFRNVDLGKLSNALIGANLVKVSGNGDMELDIKSSGSSPAALIHDLSGNGTVNGKTIVLDGVDVKRFAKALSYDSKPGDTITGLWKGTTKGGSSKFDTLDGVLAIKNGIVELQKMDLDGSESSIVTRGRIDLPKWWVSTKHTITVKPQDDIPSDVPPFDISINGSLDNPAQNIGQSLLNDYLNRKIQRKFNKILSDQLGFPANDNKAPQNQGNGEGNSNNAPKRDPVEDLAEEAIKGIFEEILR